MYLPVLTGIVIFLCAHALSALAADPLPGQLKWKFPTDYSGVRACPVIDNGTVYAGSTGEGFFALDAATGEHRWTTNAYETYNGATIAHDGTVVMGDYGGSFRALDPRTGGIKWRLYSRVCVHTTPAVGMDGTLYPAGDALYAMDVATGLRQWTFDTSFYESSPVIGRDGTIYIAAMDSNLYAVDGITGQKKWEHLQAAFPFASPALGADDTVYIGSPDAKVLALHPSTGEKIWEFQADGFIQDSFAVGSNGVLYFTCVDSNVYSLSATGSSRWKFLTGMEIRTTPALAADGTLYVGSDKLYALDSATGGLKWAFDAGGHVSSPNIGPDGTIYFGVSNSESGAGIYAVHGIAPLADTPWPKFQHDAQHRGRQVTSGAAVVTRPPPDRWAAVDAPTAFSFYSPTVRPLQVQWRFNGEDIPGATNEALKIERVRFEDAGLYSVLISNQFGGDLSAEALLNVGYSLHTRTNGRGTIQIGPDLAVYPTNTVVQLAATPHAPRAFLGWQGTVASPSNVLTVTLTTNYQLTANFEFIAGDKMWEFSTPGYEISATPAIGPDGTLYVTGADARMFALDPLTRRAKWQSAPAISVFQAPALSFDGILYVPGGSNIFALSSLTGEKLAEFPTGYPISSPVALGIDGTLYCSSYFGQAVLAIDSSTGARRWEFNLGVSEPTPSLAIGPDATVYFSTYHGRLFALDGFTGRKKWEFHLGDSSAGSPIVGSNGTVYASGSTGPHPNTQHTLYAIDGGTGLSKWQFGVPHRIRSSPALGPHNTLHFAPEFHYVCSLDATTGAKRWDYQRSLGGSPCVGADGTVYYCTYLSGLVAFDGVSGQIKWEAEFDERFRDFSPTLGSDGTLYVASQQGDSSAGDMQGKLLAIKVPAGLAQSPWPKAHGHLDNRGRAYSRPFLDPRKSRVTGQAFELVLHGEPGESLNLYSSLNLRDWTPLGLVTNHTGTATLNHSSTTPLGFYRVEALR